jgi:hypothetical protein
MQRMLFHAKGLGWLNASYAQRREEARGDRDHGKHSGNGKQGEGIMIVDSVKLAAENLPGKKREGNPGDQPARSGYDA